MIKLRFSKPQYKTYCNGKVTVCTFKCTLLDTSDKVFYEKFQVQGKSVCADDDVLDASKGRRLAEARAKVKAYKKAKNHYSIPSEENLKWQFQRLLEVSISSRKLKNCYKNELEHIKRLLGE